MKRKRHFRKEDWEGLSFTLGGVLIISVLYISFCIIFDPDIRNIKDFFTIKWQSRTFETDNGLLTISVVNRQEKTYSIENARGCIVTVTYTGMTGMFFDYAGKNGKVLVSATNSLCDMLKSGVTADKRYNHIIIVTDVQELRECDDDYTLLKVKSKK